LSQTSYIEIELSTLSYHSWPNAPEHREYLKPRHQHVFTVKVRVGVTDLDREVEYHDLRDKANGIITTMSFDNSCENNARYIYDRLKRSYSPLAVWVGEEGNVWSKYGDVVV